MLEKFVERINDVLKEELSHLLQDEEKTYFEVIRNLQQSKFNLKPYEVVLVEELQQRVKNISLGKPIKD